MNSEMGSRSTSVVRCSTHNNARAAWECGKCGKALCPACAAPDHIDRVGDVIRCIHCGGIAKAIMLERPVDPWWKKVPMFLKAVFSIRGAIQVLLVGFALLVSKFMMIVPIIGWVLGPIVYFGVMASYLFLVLQAGSNGATQLPSLGDMGRDFSDLAYSSFRLILSTWIIWLPIIIYIFVFSSSSFLVSVATTGSTSSVFFLVLMLVGAIYIPAAFILAALADSIVDAMNPLMVIGIIMRAPGQYLGVALFSGALFLGNGVLERWIGVALGPMCISNFAKTFALLWLVKAQSMFLPVLTALVLGWFMHQNAKAFELPESGNWGAAMPNARPMGKLPAQSPEQETEAQPLVQDGFPQALELESTPEEALAGSLKMGNDSIAIESYKKIIAAGRVPDLDVDNELQLAGVLERAGDLKGAVHSYRRVMKKDLQGPKAPYALFHAARILHDGLGAKGDAKKLAQFLVDKFPGDELAQQAQRFLV